MYDACVPWPERPKGAKDEVKGHQLEVGTRRAPKLLVFNNSATKINITLTFFKSTTTLLLSLWKIEITAYLT